MNEKLKYHKNKPDQTETGAPAELDAEEFVTPNVLYPVKNKDETKEAPINEPSVDIQPPPEKEHQVENQLSPVTTTTEEEETKAEKEKLEKKDEEKEKLDKWDGEKKTEVKKDEEEKAMKKDKAFVDDDDSISITGPIDVDEEKDEQVEEDNSENLKAEELPKAIKITNFESDNKYMYDDPIDTEPTFIPNDNTRDNVENTIDNIDVLDVDVQMFEQREQKEEQVENQTKEKSSDEPPMNTQPTDSQIPSVSVNFDDRQKEKTVEKTDEEVPANEQNVETQPPLVKDTTDEEKIEEYKTEKEKTKKEKAEKKESKEKKIIDDDVCLAKFQNYGSLNYFLKLQSFNEDIATKFTQAF
ncbi:uncharacterized protein LOC131876767 [Cryptomeria japonica]|uniref:uncharacterized protein LOC131876767 n=1 Tax=Cryptomeria japonica TaxID=3369 RepID=UPI0027DA4CE4|nr:uncharacterized protein LOC131876767 [Cryptomeria japonica]